MAIGSATLTASFTPEDNAEFNFCKVLAGMIVNGGRLRVDNQEGERAIFQWGGVEGARINVWEEASDAD